MKIKECIQLAAEALNLDATLTGKSDIDRLLLRCANNCLDEITSEYIPLKEIKTVTAKDGRITYAQLGTAVYDVTEVKRQGVKENFELLPSYIVVKSDGEYEVSYYTRPNTLTLSDDVPISLHLTPRVISYGIAAEYLLISGFYEEAAMYDRRFKDALIRLTGGDKNRKVKRRRWLL